MTKRKNHGKDGQMKEKERRNPFPESHLGPVLEAYFLDISAPLLSEEEIKNLSRIYRRGRKAQKILETISDDDEQERLQTTISEGEQAKNQLITSNLRLVWLIAERFCVNPRLLPDLIQEGSLGLIRAVEKFDPDKGYRFSTYAAYWISQKITRFFFSDQLVRVPVRVGQKLRKIEKTISSFLVRNSRRPTIAEIAQETDMSILSIRTALANPNFFLLPIDDPREDEEKAPPFAETIADDKALDPEEAAISAIFQEVLERALEQLTFQQKRIIEYEFGLNGGNPETFSQMKKRFGFSSRERPRQLSNEAKKRLKHPRIARELKNWL